VYSVPVSVLFLGLDVTAPVCASLPPWAPPCPTSSLSAHSVSRASCSLSSHRATQDLGSGSSCAASCAAGARSPTPHPLAPAAAVARISNGVSQGRPLPRSSFSSTPLRDSPSHCHCVLVSTFAVCHSVCGRHGVGVSLDQSLQRGGLFFTCALHLLPRICLQNKGNGLDLKDRIVSCPKDPTGRQEAMMPNDRGGTYLPKCVKTHVSANFLMGLCVYNKEI